MAHQEAAAAEQRLAFLARASAVLAGSLDYEVTLQSVARQAVPMLADICMVDIAADDGTIQRLAVAATDSRREALVRDLRRRYPPDPNGPHQVAQVLRTGRPVLYPELPEWYAEAVAHDPSHLDLLRALEMRSVMGVPLVARERTLGVMSFLVVETARRYGPADLTLAEDLAGRCALAIDNARLYREAQEAIGLRDEFLSLAAHELKTPITTLRGHAQLLARRLKDRQALDLGRLRRALQIIDQQSGKLTQLITQILDVSHLQREKLALDRRAADLVTIAERAVAAARVTSSEHQLVLRAPTLLPASVDVERLELVVANLLDNAIKHSPPGSQITVDVSSPGPETARIEVRDQGPGIATEHRARVFERFFQAPEKRAHYGLGLGLYVSREIVEAHGGQITVEFPPDGGTHVIITQPTGTESARR